MKCSPPLRNSVLEVQLIWGEQRKADLQGQGSGGGQRPLSSLSALQEATSPLLLNNPSVLRFITIRILTVSSNLLTFLRAMVRRF